MKVTVFLFHCSRCFYFWHANLISLLFEPDGKTNVLHSMSINWCITLVVSHGFHCFCSCFASIITFSSEKPPQQMLNALAKPTTKSDIYFVISIEYFYAPVNHKLIMSMLHQSHFIKAKAIFHEYFLVEFILFLYDFPLLAFYKFVQRIQYDTKEWRERKKKSEFMTNSIWIDYWNPKKCVRLAWNPSPLIEENLEFWTYIHLYECAVANGINEARSNSLLYQKDDFNLIQSNGSNSFAFHRSWFIRSFASKFSNFNWKLILSKWPKLPFFFRCGLTLSTRSAVVDSTIGRFFFNF